MAKLLTGIRLFLLFAATSLVLSAEEANPSLGLEYSITTSESGELVWEIKDAGGNVRDLSEDEKNRLLREKYFPEALAAAGAGKAPEVWIVGFFYLDGVATEKDLGKAEEAFRRGLELGRPDGLLYLADYFYKEGMIREREREEKSRDFDYAEALTAELLEAGHKEAASFAISLASVHMFAWYGAEKDLDKAETILDSVEALMPENPLVQLMRAKLLIYRKDYSAAFTYAEKAEKGFLAVPEGYGVIEEELRRAKAAKISAAVLGGDLSKIDPDEFLQISKDSLGLNGPFAWSIPVLLALILGFLLWRTRRSWREGQGPGLRLSLFWISASILAAGIGFNIRLPGLDNGVGHWIGAILVTAATLAVVKMGGWGHHFGRGPFFSGWLPFLKGAGIVVAGVAGLQLVASGYSAIYEMISGGPLDKQLVSLFLKSENLLQLAGTVLIVGLAIPFYEEVFFRGFLFDSLDRRWGGKTALVVSSVFFALVHGLTFFVPLLFLSFLIGWLRYKTGNLRMSFYLHAANNSFSVLAGYFLSSGG
jgi:membrane protease YdiL (CAAX protease family)/tetratricopeptide (TPR) repeat protein